LSFSSIIAAVIKLYGFTHKLAQPAKTLIGLTSGTCGAGLAETTVEQRAANIIFENI
jgi:hypothetical protein